MIIFSRNIGGINLIITLLGHKMSIMVHYPVLLISVLNSVCTIQIGPVGQVHKSSTPTHCGLAFHFQHSMGLCMTADTTEQNIII